MENKEYQAARFFHSGWTRAFVSACLYPKYKKLGERREIACKRFVREHDAISPEGSKVANHTPVSDWGMKWGG
jgi:hypothetical protein